MKTKKNDFTPNHNLAIEIHGFTKKFKKFVAVDNIHMKVAKGKIHGFIGPNGSGKTTTIKSLIGAIIPTVGNFSIDGLKANSSAAKKLLDIFLKMLVFQNI